MMMQDNNPETLLNQRLWSAAAAGDSKTIRMLAMGGVDIDVRNEDGFTAFNIATQHGHSDTAMTILAVREMQYARKIGVEPAEFFQTDDQKSAARKSA